MKIRKIKLGQSEIFGLIIIVILLTLGMVFIISAKSTQDKKNRKSNYLDQTLAQNTINAMLNMKTECKPGLNTGIKLSQLIIDCADRQAIFCTSTSETSCEYINRTIKNLLDLTLEKWNKAYYFNISDTGISFSTKKCNPRSRYEREPPGKQPIPIRTKSIQMYLMICKV